MQQINKGKRLASHELLKNAQYCAISYAPNRLPCAEVIMTRDKKNCIVIEHSQNCPDCQNLWIFENDKLVRFEQNHSNSQKAKPRKTFYFNSESKLNKIDLYHPGAKKPYANYHYDNLGEVIQYTTHEYRGSKKDDYQRAHFFVWGDLSIYSESINDKKAHQKIYYDRNGKYSSAVLVNVENINGIDEIIKTEYSYDLAGSPSYITRYANPVQRYICYSGRATKIGDKL